MISRVPLPGENGTWARALGGRREPGSCGRYRIVSSIFTQPPLHSLCFAFSAVVLAWRHNPNADAADADTDTDNLNDSDFQGSLSL